MHCSRWRGECHWYPYRVVRLSPENPAKAFGIVAAVVSAAVGADVVRAISGSDLAETGEETDSAEHGELVAVYVVYFENSGHCRRSGRSEHSGCFERFACSGRSVGRAAVAEDEAEIASGSYYSYAAVVGLSADRAVVEAKDPG